MTNPGKILAVDDTADSLELLTEILATAGYQVRPAISGQLALSAAALDPPDLVLLDIRMPGMDGYEVCRRLRAEPATRDVPVIFVSALSETDDKVRGFALGAVDFVTKPYEAGELLARVRTHLELGRLRNHLQEQVRIHTRQLEQEVAERSRAEQGLRESEARFRAISAAAQDAIIVMDHAGCIAYWNAAAEQIFGHSADEALGKELHPLLAPERFLEQYRAGFARFQASATGPALGKTLELAARRKDGSEFPIELSLSTVQIAGRNHAIGIVRDISGRKRTEAGLQRLNRALRTISRCNEVLVHATDEATLLQDMCRTVVETGQYRVAWVGYAEHDPARSVRPAARFGADQGYLDRATITWADDEHGRGPTGTAIRTNSVQVNQDFATNPRTAPWREAALQCGLAASIALPLASESAAFGALTIYAGEPDAFDAQEVAVLTELASDLAYGIAALRTRAERDRALKDLQLAAKVFEESKEGILITDADCRILAVNGAFTSITGYSADEVRGLNPRVLKSDRHDSSFFANMWAAIGQTGHWMGEIWNRRKDGELFPALQSISAVRDRQGQLTHYLGIFGDISSNKESEARISYLTQHDALTGLANRNMLFDRLEQALIHARRADRLVALVLLDIDGFKLINDGLGHVAGDFVLKEVAARLSGACRPGDTVARLGGDAFVLVLSDLAHENDAASLARNLLAVVAAPMTVDGHEVVVTASLGVALFPRDGELAPALLKNADAAMHRAKELGRNSVQFYAPRMNARMLERLELEAGLRRAIERCEFVLYYQPKVELARGRIIGAEALIRWRHPSMGMVSPGDFIPLAEETGLIIPIGEWVIETACGQLRSWLDAGLDDLVLSVNLSARQFQQDGLGEFVAAALRRHDLRARCLELEVTESAVMQDPEQTTAILSGLKAIGVRISLDDFGTGYSSLNYLKRFPIDTLKIDQSFIHDITSDPDDAAIARSVISLAHSLKHQVVAEGVETEAQLAFLRRHQCDQIQGYHFCRPLPADEFAQLMRSGKSLPAGPVGAEGQRTLLIVDDEENVLASLRRLLRQDGYRILTAGGATEAFRLLALNEVEVIISDQRMTELSGTEFLSRVKELYPDTIRLVLSGYTELESVTSAINRGAIFKFITKPWEDDALREQILEAFMLHESKQARLHAGAHPGPTGPT
jgi:diguanylate cyclase (GGDEF)-like protein/PAS domain S-box-containing protein